MLLKENLIAWDLERRQGNLPKSERHAMIRGLTILHDPSDCVTA
jgi:hypothetical protein